MDDGRDQDDRPPSGLQDRLDEVGSLTGARVERCLRVWRCFDEYRMCSFVDVRSGVSVARTEPLGSH